MNEITKPFIIKIQKFFNLNPTGEYDSHTEAAVKNYQYLIKENPTGKINTATYNSLASRLNLYSDSTSEETVSDSVPFDYESESLYTTDQSETFCAFSDIEEYLLPPNEYVSNDSPVTRRDYIFLHFTAGWNNPYRVVDDWASDTRGRVATHFVLGGVNIANHDFAFDGKMIRCMPWDRWGFHLGKVDATMHKNSYGIEICNFGPLTKKNSDYYTYTGRRIGSEYVSDLGFEFKGHRYWHKFTDKQLEETRALLIFLGKHDGIDLTEGLQKRLRNQHPRDAFNFDRAASQGAVKGLLSHTNVSTSKNDVAPQPELIDLIKSL